MTTALHPNYRLISDHQFAVVLHNTHNDQKGFFAQQSYSPGDLIADFSASAILDRASYLTVQVGIDRHILLQPEHLQYINHSCDPNVFFDTSAMNIVALKAIEMGEEMSFFYPSTEWSMAQPFTCTCNSPYCLGIINGAAHISEDIMSSYRLTNFIQQQLHDRSSKEKRA